MAKDLCKNLKLTIREEEHPIEPGHTQIRAILRDDKSLEEIEVTYECNERVKGSLRSERYFLLEACVLAVRNLISQAAVKEMIKLPPSTLKPRGVQISLSDVEIEEKLPTTLLTGEALL